MKREILKNDAFEGILSFNDLGHLGLGSSTDPMCWIQLVLFILREEMQSHMIGMMKLENIWFDNMVVSKDLSLCSIPRH